MVVQVGSCDDSSLTSLLPGLGSPVYLSGSWSGLSTPLWLSWSSSEHGGLRLADFPYGRWLLPE